VQKVFLIVICLLISWSTLKSDFLIYPENYAQINIYGNVPEMVKLLKVYINYANTNPNNYDAQWRVSQLISYLGEELLLENKEEKLVSLITLGKNCGKKAMLINPKGKEGIYWYLKNLILYNHLQDVSSIEKFVFKKIFKKMLKLKKLDPNAKYEHGAWLRLLGRYFSSVPPPPIASGDVDKGINYLVQAYGNYPEFGPNGIFLARAYLLKGNYNDALKILTNVRSILMKKNYKIFEVKRDLKRVENLQKLVKKYKMKGTTPSVFTIVANDYYVNN